MQILKIPVDISLLLPDDDDDDDDLDLWQGCQQKTNLVSLLPNSSSKAFFEDMNIHFVG